jgi:hypothetical protein
MSSEVRNLDVRLTPFFMNAVQIENMPSSQAHDGEHPAMIGTAPTEPGTDPLKQV